jgi:nuclear respiratory factor 1
VRNCYKHHGRDDLLQVFNDEPQHHQQQVITSQVGGSTVVQHSNYAGTMVQTINNPDGTVSIIQIDTAPHNAVVTLPDGTQATVVHAVSNTPPYHLLPPRVLLYLRSENPW